MELNIKINNTDNNKFFNLTIENKKFQKMLFFYNSIENGWRIKKDGNDYVFTKKHQNKIEIYNDDKFIQTFIDENLNI
jgi:hypothetical protein